MDHATLEALKRGHPLDVEDDARPFAGELLQVQPTDATWEGAIERLLHSFGLSLLVPDAHYAGVAQWVDRTHLGERLVYYRVRPQHAMERFALHSSSLVHKIDVKPGLELWSWHDAELARRFDYACCDTLDELRRETRAITKSGQTKGGGERHEKDDRHRIDDRSRYVLGWTNEAKIATLEKQARGLEARIQGSRGQGCRPSEGGERARRPHWRASSAGRVRQFSRGRVAAPRIADR